MKLKKDMMNALRDRRRAEGLVKLELWVRQGWQEKIREFARKLADGG